MADTAVQVAIQLLKPLITAEVSLISGLADDVRAITDELLSIVAFLKSSEERAVGDEGTKAWVRQVRTLAYDIEDVIEEYQIFQKENAYGKAKNYFLRRVQGLATSIKSIRRRAVDIAKARDAYRFNNVVEQGACSSLDSQTSTFTVCISEESELVGVEIPRGEIIELLDLKKLNKRSSTVAVVGMRGLGKTAVVRSIYNDPRVKFYFPLRAWISVSRTCSRVDILKSMVKQFYEAENESNKLFEKVSWISHFHNYATEGKYVDQINSMDLSSLQDLVRKYMKEERYLVVFDNAQDGNIGMVTYVKGLLCTNNEDSKILVTTRYECVASALLEGSCCGLYKLRPLPSEEAWKLFCKKTFQSHEGKCPSWLEDLGRGIVEKCEGLAPAILAIGRLLSTKLDDLFEWQKVYDSLGFYLDKNRQLTGIYDILIRNYYDLPYYLKPCFLYFGLFPKGHPVDRMRLIRLWIAEGFITEGRGNLTLEEVAEEYLNELISMSLVEVGHRDPTGRLKTLRIHAFLHEIILSKLDELGFCQILSGKNTTVDENPRRLSIHKDYIPDACDFLNRITKGKSSVRCVYVFEPAQDILAKVLTSTFLKNAHLLKVLDLCNTPIEEIPYEVGKLRNLRLLSLRNTRVGKLPKSIGKLKDLQTLNLKQTPIQKLPTAINGLHKLRHLLNYSYEHDFAFSSHIQKVRGVKISDAVLNLGELQKLAFVDLGHGTRLLGKLRNLRRLGITELKLEDGKDLCAAIEEMKYLQSLSLYSKSNTEMIDLEHFQSPPQTLKRLFLNGPLKSFPRWIFDLHGLVKLRLRWSCLHDSEPFENLSALPNLVELQLLEAYIGEFLEITNGGFKKLKILHLLDFHELECLLINEGALPLLEELSIGESSKLQVPSGIQYLRRLKILNFFNMSECFTCCLRPGGQYYSVVQHVPNVFIQVKREGFWESYTLR